jgi:hypothetical protein
MTEELFTQLILEVWTATPNLPAINIGIIKNIVGKTAFVTNEDM